MIKTEKKTLPQASDWDKFWDVDHKDKQKSISWSKKRIVRTIDPFLKDAHYVLDAGCGSGFFTKYFCDLGIKTYACDYSDKALTMTDRCAEGRAVLLKKNLLDKTLEQKITPRFDVIFTDGLFEHFSRTEQDLIFQNFKLILNSDGFIITFVPNRWSPWELIRPLYMPGIEERPFVLKELRDLNQRNGTNVILSGGINTLPLSHSPDKSIGHLFGMLLFSIAKNNG